MSLLQFSNCLSDRPTSCARVNSTWRAITRAPKQTKSCNFTLGCKLQIHHVLLLFLMLLPGLLLLLLLRLEPESPHQ